MGGNEGKDREGGRRKKERGGRERKGGRKEGKGGRSEMEKEGRVRKERGQRAESDRIKKNCVCLYGRDRCTQ